MKRNTIFALLALLIAALVLTAAACGGDDDGGGDGGGGGGQAGSLGDIEPLPSASCQKPKFEGDQAADVLIASDLPMQGSSRTQSVQIVQAIEYLLDQRGWKAGDKYVAYQACDDSTAQAAKWDPGKCSTNANAYAQNEKLVGVIGTFNSGCAQIEIPILNRAPGGGLLLLSPANTYGCLTEPCSGPEPEKYYPTGTRNYARVAPSDPNQGAVVAQFMKEQGVKSVYILNDKEAYGLGVATNLRGAAEAAGIKIAGFSAYEGKPGVTYEALFTKVKATGADAVFVGGLIDENGGQLIDDKVAVLGPNDGKVKLFLPDGFTSDATFDPKQGGTKNAKGAFFSVAGAPIDEFKGKGGEFIKDFGEQVLKGEAVDPYAVYGAQAADILFTAIEKSDGSRQGVIEEVFNTKVEDGYAGSFEINENGDISGASGAAVTFTIYSGETKLESVKTLVPEEDIVEAARQEAAGG